MSAPGLDASGVLACPLCGGPLRRIDGARRCTGCGDFPDLGGVAVLVPSAEAVLRELRAQLVERWAAAEAQAAGGPEAAYPARHSGDAVLARAEGIRANYALLERALAPVVGGPRVPSRWSIAELLGRSGGWSFERMLPYFAMDWSEPPMASRTPSRVAETASRHAPEARAALVVGCGAGGLVGELAARVGVAWGADLALPALLLARRLLDGEDASFHLESLDWAPITLRGMKRRVGEVHLVAADAATLPFADDSFDVVTTQFLLDVAPAPALALDEVLRVLAPDGVWIHDGPAFAFGRGSAGKLRSEEAWRSFAAAEGLELLEYAREDAVHLAPTLGSWATRSAIPTLLACCRKVTRRPVEGARNVWTAWFAGDRPRLDAAKPRLSPGTDVWLRRSQAGQAADRIRIGDLDLYVADAARMADLLNVLDALDGRSTTSEVAAQDPFRTGERARGQIQRDVPAASDASPQREVVLALHALWRGGLLELA